MIEKHLLHRSLAYSLKEIVYFFLFFLPQILLQLWVYFWQLILMYFLLKLSSSSGLNDETFSTLNPSPDAFVESFSCLIYVLDNEEDILNQPTAGVHSFSPVVTQHNYIRQSSLYLGCRFQGEDILWMRNDTCSP